MTMHSTTSIATHTTIHIATKARTTGANTRDVTSTSSTGGALGAAD